MKAWERQKEFELSLPEVVIALTSRWHRQENMFKELKVRMFDRIEEEKIVRLADGKKLFFDWLKMCSI